jgi:hypothetical protein
LAINTADGKLYYKDSTNNVKVIAANVAAIANGGSGATTAQGAMNAFAGAVTSGSYLRGNGTNVVMSAIQASDVPTLNQNTTGTAGNVSGTVAIANGGTGQTTASAAFDALAPSQTSNSGKFLTTNGTTTSWAAVSGGSGTVSSVSVVSANGLAGTVATSTTTPAITLSTTVTGVLKGNGTAISAATAGTDYVVPGGALGTPSSGTLTNCTFPTLNQNTTGSSATFTSTTQNSQFNSVGVGTAGSGTAGEIRATNNVTAYYSDDRFKTNLGNIPNALDKVHTLNGFYYEANELAQSYGYDVKREVGVSAQQVQAIMPEVVAPAPIDENYLTVRYERLVPLLIEAIKELTAKVEALEAK